MRVVVALGGNALLKRGEPMTADVQRENVEIAARSLAPVALEHELVLSHGNGPQVGDIMLRNELARKEVPPNPLDVCVAESEGTIGYYLQQALLNKVRRERNKRFVVTEKGALYCFGTTKTNPTTGELLLCAPENSNDG